MDVVVRFASAGRVDKRTQGRVVASDVPRPEDGTVRRLAQWTP